MDRIRGQISQSMMIAGAVGFVLGLVIGLFVLGWWLWPVQWSNAAVSNLRQDLQLDYMAMSAQSYARNQDAVQAQQRWNELGEAAPSLYTKLQQTPPTGLSPEDLAAFSAAANPVAGLTPDVDKADAKKNPLMGVLVGMCLLTLLIGALLLYLFFFRKRQPAVAGNRVGTVPMQTMATPSAIPADRQMIGPYLTTYNLGNDLYDDSFSIDLPNNGEFLGECGVGIAETIGVGDPKKVTAFEVWLFDKNDIQTVTKVLMSEHAYNDPSISQRLASKGEPALAEAGKRITLETESLRLEARVINMSYGKGALQDKSFFDQITIELSIQQQKKA